MSRNVILVLTDDVHLTEGIPLYAWALAERSDADVHFLLLLRPDPYLPESNGNITSVAANLDELTTRSQQLLSRYLEDTQARVGDVGVVQATVRVGDPASELLKFLAANPVPFCVVWGGNKDIFASGKLKKHSDHWLAKVQDSITCPVVASI